MGKSVYSKNVSAQGESDFDGPFVGYSTRQATGCQGRLVTWCMIIACISAGVLAVIAAIVCSVLLTVWLPIIYEYSEAHFYECPLEDTRALPDDATLELTTPFTGNSSSGRTSNSANAVCLSMQSATEYNLTWDASGPEFLQEWAFFTGDDPSKGTVNYVSKEDAMLRNLTFYNQDTDTWHIKADSINTVNSTAKGRDSVRLHSSSEFIGGVFLMELDHMPTGCGTWPAWWMHKDPGISRGRIDIIDTFNDFSVNQASGHVLGNCDLSNVDDIRGTRMYRYPWRTIEDFFGNTVNNCNRDVYESGCMVLMPSGTAGKPFNDAEGGAYAMVWDDAGIAIYFWSNSCGGIPEDLRCGKPDPSTWGTPMHRIPFGPNCSRDLWGPLRMAIGLNFCGTGAGTQEGFASCRADLQVPCDDHVRNSPGAFKEAYWGIKSLKVYQRPQDYMGYALPTTTPGFSSPLRR